MRFLSAFGRFWYGFLVGDRPELFIGPIVALAVVAFALALGVSASGGVLLFALIIATGGWALADDVRAIRATATAGQRAAHGSPGRRVRPHTILNGAAMPGDHDEVTKVTANSIPPTNPVQLCARRTDA